MNIETINGKGVSQIKDNATPYSKCISVFSGSKNSRDN